MQEEDQEAGEYEHDEASQDDLAGTDAVVKPPCGDGGRARHDIGDDGEDDDLVG